MSDIQPTPRAEFEALLQAADAAAMEDISFIPLAVLKFLAYCEDKCATIAAALDNAAPAALPDDWQPSPELGD